MELEVQYPVHNCPPIIPILNRIDTISRIDTCLFKNHSDIVVQSMPRPS